MPGLQYLPDGTKSLLIIRGVEVEAVMNGYLILMVTNGINPTVNYRIVTNSF
ncbi:hypothetical protein [Catalinimonas locisalis]|uniref:hypothetical protein n=1 Tax=Catalinimonas locisalis TaxID=3133978 RepID=UPI003100BF13